MLKIIERVSENKTKIFFPSTIYIDQKNKNFSEYIEAKKKAENLCNSINKKNNLKYSILYEKLPRILTGNLHHSMTLNIQMDLRLY